MQQRCAKYSLLNVTLNIENWSIFGKVELIRVWLLVFETVVYVAADI